jgi:hypothetical protein
MKSQVTVPVSKKMYATKQFYVSKEKIVINNPIKRHAPIWRVLSYANGFLVFSAVKYPTKKNINSYVLDP